MEKIQEFLTRLTQLTEETGIVIEPFGDPFYNPRLEGAAEPVWFCYEETQGGGGKYVARTGDPYDGEIIF